MANSKNTCRADALVGNLIPDLVLEQDWQFSVLCVDLLSLSWIS